MQEDELIGLDMSHHGGSAYKGMSRHGGGHEGSSIRGRSTVSKEAAEARDSVRTAVLQ